MLPRLYFKNLVKGDIQLVNKGTNKYAMEIVQLNFDKGLICVDFAEKERKTFMMK